MFRLHFPKLASPLPLAPVALAAVLAAGCAAEKKQENYVERPISTLYDDAMGKLAAKDHKAAAKAFDEVDRQHPYSAWAVKAQLMAAYSYYEAGKFDDAILAADRFIDLYPANTDVAYAYYLKALCYYEQISDVSRDQKMTIDARAALNEVITRFPDSEYARDARLKLDLATDHLAGKEMEIGRWYENAGNWLAAVNRFQKVATDYQTTSHVPEALYRLVEVYTKLGLRSEAKKSGAVLGYNYPGSDWYAMAYRILLDDNNAPETAPEPSKWYAKLWPW